MARARSPGRARSVQITDRDRELLGFVAEHRLVLAVHAQALSGRTAAATYQRLASLCAAGLLSHRKVFHREPGCYQISRAGLAAIGSELPPPRMDLRCYSHDVGLAWLWLAARGGAFGALQSVVSERTMRSRDGKSGARADGPPDACGDLFGVRLGGVGAGGREKLHYPDLLLLDRGGRRAALELELSAKGRTRTAGILAAYGADRRTDAVLYLVQDGRLATSLASSARAMGLSSLVQVQRVRWAHGRPGAPELGSPARVPRRRSVEAAR